MLYVPWRKEPDINDDLKAIFLENKELIIQNSAKYNVMTESLMQQFESYEKDEDENKKDEEEEEKLDEIVSEIGVLEQMGLQNPNQNQCQLEKWRPPPLMEDSEYFKLMRTLNKGQRKYCMNLLHLFKVKSKKLPIYHYIAGGAGVGKSLLIKAIQQTLLRWLTKTAGFDPNKISILLSAFTGLAACNIKGCTLHGAFCLPINQNGEAFNRLSDEISHHIAYLLIMLILIIIDEVSMVGARMLYQINERLKQIFKKNEDFGGISIIVVGDLNQLKPPGDKYIFDSDPSCKYLQLVDSPLWRKFSYYKLTEVMRQKNDLLFAKALNNIPLACCDKNDIKLLKSRCFEETEVPKECNVHLFWPNIQVDEFNNRTIKKKKIYLL